MNKFVTAMATVSAVALAGPAFAQQGYQQNNQQGYQQNGYPGANADSNLSARIDQLRVRLQTGVQNGSISRGEIRPLRQQLRQLVQLERQFAVNGISGQERGELQRRMRNLRQALRTADGGSYNRDRDEQFEGNGGNGYTNGGYNPNAGRIDNNRDGWDDRDFNRNGRWDDDVNNGGYQQQYQQQQYQQQPARGGLGGIVDSLLGRGTSGLRAGQQAPGNLYGLQGGYRDQFRDGNGSYFRTDGRQIYQIDARTQTVVRVYPMNR